MKKLARYLVARARVVWRYAWQDEARGSWTYGDSDWGGTARDRKSTSGGCFVLGGHCIKTWSATQQAIALSSAEAELYAMVEAVTRAKGLCSFAREIGFVGLDNVIWLGTDSSAAQSFVSRRGLGRMRHLDIRDMWLQKEVLEGNVVVAKVAGTKNPADLMTKTLAISDIAARLKMMNLKMFGSDGTEL